MCTTVIETTYATQSNSIKTLLQTIDNRYGRTNNQMASTKGRKFAGRKFRDVRVSRHFSRKFLPRHNLNSKFAKVFARETTEDSRLAKVFSIQSFSFLQFFALLFLHCPDLCSLGL